MEGHIMSSKVNTVKPKPNANEALMAKLGIKASQVDQTKVNTTPKAKVINSNADRLKHNAKEGIAKVNQDTGKNITFQCFERKGKTKDGEPKFEIKGKSGFWTIDETKDGLFIASRVHYYTETFTIADYKEI